MENNLSLLKNRIFNRRFKAWRVWFYTLTGVALVCIFKESLEIFKFYAFASTAGIGALIGGLSWTDWANIKNGRVE